MDIAIILENEAVRSGSQFLTIIFAGLGMYYTYKLAMFFVRSNKELSTFLKAEYWSDLLLYLVTLLIGVALFLDISSAVWALVLLRPWVVLLNVFALRKLYRHLKGV